MGDLIENSAFNKFSFLGKCDQRAKHVFWLESQHIVSSQGGAEQASLLIFNTHSNMYIQRVQEAISCLIWKSTTSSCIIFQICESKSSFHRKMNSQHRHLYSTKNNLKIHETLIIYPYLPCTLSFYIKSRQTGYPHPAPRSQIPRRTRHRSPTMQFPE